MNLPSLVKIVFNYIGGISSLMLAGIFTTLGVFTTYVIPIAAFLLTIFSILAAITTILKNWKEGKLGELFTQNTVVKMVRKLKPKSKQKDDPDIKAD
jgi:uncharacterized protein YacL